MTHPTSPPDHQNLAPSPSLAETLAAALPKDFTCIAHHLSTPPTLSDPLCYPPAYPSPAPASFTPSTTPRARKPLKTYVEKHFLLASLPCTPNPIFIFALEINIYTTSHSTTLFVSKADSTGYLSLASLPAGSGSVLRGLTTAFLEFLTRSRRRHGRACVVNLFARAQSQYLFPGSVDNALKHVLDDRGLVRWWCRALHPLLSLSLAGTGTQSQPKAHAYLRVPGLDVHETRAFTPLSPQWRFQADPLAAISPYPLDVRTYGRDIPPRCLIPVYPDDPKARLVLEMEEAAPDQLKLALGWRGIRTMAEFWEMMAFRQECSSGRLTGFVWLVFDADRDSKGSASQKRNNNSVGDAEDPNSKRRKKKTKTPLKGVIVPREPRVKTHHAFLAIPPETPHYYWPADRPGRGAVVLDDQAYHRAVELLLRLEFDTVEHASTNTARWVREVKWGVDWGVRVLGTKEVQEGKADDDRGRKRAAEGGSDVNVLGAGLVRKKARGGEGAAEGEVKVNVLTGNLVRRKAPGG